MGTFGERLQREREMRGITLDDIAEATKIGTRMLRALEEEQFDRLPGGIFNKGFVRAYARYLGIDEEQAVADYQSALKQNEPTGEPARAGLPEDRTEVIEENETSSRAPAGALVLLLVLAVAAGAWYWYNRRKTPQEEATVSSPTTQAQTPSIPVPPASPSGRVTSAAKPAGAPVKGSAAVVPNPAKQESRPNPSVAAATTAATAATEKSPGFVLLVRAREESWTEITADGKVILSGLLNASQERSVHAQKEVVLKTGNAGGLELTFNGKPVPPLGDTGQVRTVTVGPDGVRP